MVVQHAQRSIQIADTMIESTNYTVVLDFDCGVFLFLGQEYVILSYRSELVREFWSS